MISRLVYHQTLYALLSCELIRFLEAHCYGCIIDTEVHVVRMPQYKGCPNTTCCYGNSRWYLFFRQWPLMSDEGFMKIAKHVASGPNWNLWPLVWFPMNHRETRACAGLCFYFYKPQWVGLINHCGLCLISLKLRLLDGYILTIDTNHIEFKWYAEQLSINHGYVPPTCKSVCIYPSLGLDQIC